MSSNVSSRRRPISGMGSNSDHARSSEKPPQSGIKEAVNDCEERRKRADRQANVELHFLGFATVPPGDNGATLKNVIFTPWSVQATNVREETMMSVIKKKGSWGKRRTAEGAELFPFEEPSDKDKHTLSSL
ncbi:uncharacterized protein LOC144330723 [Macaca mulatta]